MDSQRLKKLLTNIEELHNTLDEQVATKLELNKCTRISNRLSSFSVECDECDKYFTDLERHIMQLLDKKNPLAESDIKEHKQKLDDISSHLVKQHKLLTDGYYLSIYMSIGTSLGLVFGLLTFDNIALGLPLGLGVGVAIGAALDADAQKKGKTL